MRHHWRQESASCLRASRLLVASSRVLVAEARVTAVHFEAICKRVHVLTFEPVSPPTSDEKTRNVHVFTRRAPRRGAYALDWRAPVSGDMNDVKVITAFHLRRLRADSGLSQPQLAAHLGVDRRHVSRWERAEIGPSWAHICAMAEVFGCNPGEFYVVPEDLKVA